MNKRVRGIIINDDKLILIQRIKEEKDKTNIYYVFPGGGLEANESLEDGVKREVLEEIGIVVDVDKIKYVDKFNDTDTYFFSCKWISGIIGTGTGPEYTSLEYSNRGLYIPMEIPISQLSKLNVVPSEVRDMIVTEYTKENGENLCIKYH